MALPGDSPAKQSSTLDLLPQGAGGKKNSCVAYIFLHFAPAPSDRFELGVQAWPNLTWPDVTYIWFGSLSFTVAFRSHKFLHSRWSMSSQENLNMYVRSIPTYRSEPGDTYFAKPFRPLCRAASRLGHRKWNAQKCDKIFVNDTRRMRQTIAEQ